MLILNLDGKVCFVLQSEEINNDCFIDTDVADFLPTSAW
jgi:hypothetical protein